MTTGFYGRRFFVATICGTNIAFYVEIELSFTTKFAGTKGWSQNTGSTVDI